LTKKSTHATLPELSLTLAIIFTDPETVAPAGGCTNATLGGSLSGVAGRQEYGTNVSPATATIKTGLTFNIQLPSLHAAAQVRAFSLRLA
jgi:hypothetical protein